MQIELIAYKPRASLGSSLKGFVQVELNGKLRLWFTVFEGKHGFYLKPPSVKVDDKFLSAIEWVDPTVMTTLLKDIRDEFKRSYATLL